MRDAGDSGIHARSTVRTICAASDYACVIYPPQSLACVDSLGAYSRTAVSNPTYLACGSAHWCAIADGTAVCFGDDSFGQATAPAALRATAVAAGLRFSCALGQNREIVCWGDIAPPPPGSFLDIAAGDEHVCAITEKGEISCFGSNAVGQLQVPVGGPWRTLGAGSGSTCAIDTSGSLTCWGGLRVQGNGSSDIAVGERHVCALERDGTVFCTGANDNGQTTLDGGFLELAAGPRHSCGRRADRIVDCVGIGVPPP